MSSAASVTEWILGAKIGDEEAARRLCGRYFPRLVGLIRHRLWGRPLKGADEEDVAQVVLLDLFEGMKRGQFDRLVDRKDLWKLLVVITFRKVSDHRRWHAHEPLNGAVPLPPHQGSDSGAVNAGIGSLADSELSPEDEALAKEECQRLLDLLGDEQLKTIARLKMEGYTNEQIAEQLGTVVRTVERKLRRIRTIWAEEMEP